MANMKKLFLLMKTLRSPSELLDRMEAILTSRLEQYPNKIDYNPLTVGNALYKLCEILEHDVDWSGIEEIEKDVKERMYFFREDSSVFH